MGRVLLSRWVSSCVTLTLTWQMASGEPAAVKGGNPAERAGEPGRALAAMAGLWDWCASSGLALEYPALGPDLVRLALAAGDPGRASDVLAEVAAVAAGSDVAWMRRAGPVTHILGFPR
jgi:hypothetical protein